MNKLASCWAKRILVWSVIKGVFKNYYDFLERKKIAQKMIDSAAFLVLMAKRYYLNTANEPWGRTYEQRIQRKINYSLRLPYHCKKDVAVEESKQTMLRFLFTMACRNNLGTRILKVTKAVKMVERSWLGWKFKFVVRQALLKEKMRH